MEKITVTCVKLKDINDKDLLYIKLANGDRYEAINVGQKTFDRVSKLLQPETKKEVTKNTEK